MARLSALLALACVLACGDNNQPSGSTLPTVATVSVMRTGAGGGTVTSAPAGIDCGSTCAATFAGGTAVTLTATAASGSVFAGWSGPCSGTGICSFTLSANTTVGAAFDKAPPGSASLTVMRTGAGTGTISSTPAGIDCGTRCVASFPSGTQVTLAASAGAGSVFAGWSGACSGTGDCTLTLSGDATVGAAFDLAAQPVFRRLTVMKTGAGSGTVASSPAGIDCGATCVASFNDGTSVNLTAAPDAGSVFAGWSGACSGTGNCTLTLSSDATVSAAFDKAPPGNANLVVTRGGSGTGSVVSTPAGIDCGATCAATFTIGTQVTLAASAGANSAFTGWGGACSGTGACTVTLSGDTAVTATFDLVPVTVAVTRAGAGSGKVTSNPAGIDCGAQCSASFPWGTAVTLTAVADLGSNFAGWSGGGCSGTGDCTIALTAPASITATFTPCVNQTVTVWAMESVSINYRESGLVYRDNNIRAYNNPTGDCGGGPPCDITGWMEFDLTPIPDQSLISELVLYAWAGTVHANPTVRVQYSNANGWSRATVTQADLPRTNPQVSQFHIPVEHVYNPFPVTIGSLDWAAELADNSLTLGLDDTKLAYSYAYFDGTDPGGNRPYLRLTYCH